jgi:aminoglycoside 6'-N-acetyltransferase I
MPRATRRCRDGQRQTTALDEDRPIAALLHPYLDSGVMMKIERATSATMGSWLALREALWPHSSKLELSREAHALLDKQPAAASFLGYDHAGIPVAFAEVTLRRDNVNGCLTSPVAFLEGIYVRPDWRRRGAARLLCAAVETWAKEQGCSELASDTEIGNEDSQRMHEALGFKESERVVCYYKQVRAQ